MPFRNQGNRILSLFARYNLLGCCPGKGAAPP